MQVPKTSLGVGNPQAGEEEALISNTPICSLLCSFQSTFLHIPTFAGLCCLPHER